MGTPQELIRQHSILVNINFSNLILAKQEDGIGRKFSNIYNYLSFWPIVVIVDPRGINYSNAEESRREYYRGAIWVSISSRSLRPSTF